MAAVAVIARTTVICVALITAKFIADVVGSELRGCECCGSDTINDVAAFAGIIVNCCCWESCGCCCSDSKDNCDFCCTDSCKIYSCCCGESAEL